MSIDSIKFGGEPNQKVRKTKSGHGPRKTPRSALIPHSSQEELESTYTSSDTTDTGSDSQDLEIVFHEDDNSEDIFHIQADSPAVQLPRQRFLARYIAHETNLTLTPLQSAQQLLVISRLKIWWGGAHRKVFELSSSRSSEPLARADFASTFSNILQIKNSRGLIAELETKKPHGPYKMKIASNDVHILISSKAEKGGRIVEAQFLSVDGSNPPFPRLVSHALPQDNLEGAFGKRNALKSVKNAKFMVPGNNEEIIAVRKISKNRLEIDAKYNVLPLHCFAIGLFMFTTK